MRSLLFTPTAFNWFLIIICAVVGVLTLVLALYLLIIFQHPDDKNQAWLPKLVIILGISVSIWTVLLFPLDVANSQACALDVPLTYCDFTLPMEALWYACYIAVTLLAFAIIPFAMFYYEADSDWRMGKRCSSAFVWALLIFAFALISITVPYVYAGYVEYPAKEALTGMMPLNQLTKQSTFTECVGPLAVYDRRSGSKGLNATLVQYGQLCDTSFTNTDMLTLRVTYLMYLMAIVSTLGWVLFMVFGAIGLVALPVDLIREFLARPRKTIKRSEYIQRVREISRRAKEIKAMADELKVQRREGNSGRKWRRHVHKLEAQVLQLEEDEARVNAVYPQGEDPAYMWIITTLLYWLKLPMGAIGIAVTVTWVLQIVLYVLASPPLSPFLNNAFIAAGNVFPMFGALLFGIWVFYLQVAVIKGCLKFGLNLLIFKVHPMKHGRTMMSSFLFNVALILLATTASIQFSAQCFALYANGTSIYRTFGLQLSYLRGIKYLYIKAIFILIFLAFMLLTLLTLCIRGAKHMAGYKKARDYYA